LKPKFAVTFEQSVPPHVRFFALTCLPLWLNVALQPCWTCWLPPKSHSTFHAETLSPKLVTAMFAVNPVSHWLTV